MPQEQTKLVYVLVCGAPAPDTKTLETIFTQIRLKRRVLLAEIRTVFHDVARAVRLYSSAWAANTHLLVDRSRALGAALRQAVNTGGYVICFVSGRCAMKSKKSVSIANAEQEGWAVAAAAVRSNTRTFIGFTGPGADKYGIDDLPKWGRWDQVDLGVAMKLWKCDRYEQESQLVLLEDEKDNKADVVYSSQ